MISAKLYIQAYSVQQIYTQSSYAETTSLVRPSTVVVDFALGPTVLGQTSPSRLSRVPVVRSGPVFEDFAKTEDQTNRSGPVLGHYGDRTRPRTKSKNDFEVVLVDICVFGQGHALK
jgi:hypothetical protein